MDKTEADAETQTRAPGGFCGLDARTGDDVITNGTPLAQDGRPQGSDDRRRCEGCPCSPVEWGGVDLVEWDGFDLAEWDGVGPVEWGINPIEWGFDLVGESKTTKLTKG